MPSAALLGSGLFAHGSYLPALLTLSSLPNPPLTITTLWSRSASSVSSLSTKAADLGLPPAAALHGDSGLDAILADPAIHALVMVLPLGAQPAIIRRAWAAGKHVISEKPVGRNVREARELVEEYEREWAPKGVVWRVAENFAHETLLHDAAALLAQPAVGPVLYWRMHYETILPQGASYHATTWRTVPDYQGGFLLDGGVHWAALARTVLPARCRPYSVVASKSLHRAHMLPHDTLVGIVQSDPAATLPPRGTRTHVDGTLREEEMPVRSGRSAPHGTFVLSWAIPDTRKEGRQPNELYVVCEHATLTLTAKGRDWRVVLEPGADTGVERVEKEGGWDGVVVELADFGAAVDAAMRGEKVERANYGSPRDALWDVAFIEAALESEGKPVVIDELLRA